jgi:hypothetical protein
MRFRLIALAGAGLLLAGTAGANTLNFGTLGNLTTCSTSGNAGDRSCTSTASVTNGANDNTASANVRGQSSADQALTTDPTAIADITVSYDIPYTVTRTVSVSGLNATFPIQTITFNANWSGEVSKDNSQVAGGLGNAVAFSASFQSLGGLFTTASYTGASQLGGGGLARTSVVRTVPDPTYGTSVNFSGPAVGEITLAAQIPTNYRAWSDLLVPYGTTSPGSYTQSFTDTLRVTFRLRTESRASGSVSTTGGEALACFGQASPLGSFTLDNAASCGTGFDINASTAVTGSTVLQIIPEPSTVLLIGSALVGLAAFGARKRS